MTDAPDAGGAVMEDEPDFPLNKGSLAICDEATDNLEGHDDIAFSVLALAAAIAGVRAGMNAQEMAAEIMSLHLPAATLIGMRPSGSERLS